MAANSVDLNPNGFTDSWAMGTNGSQQVGYAGNDGMLWTGTATSAVDLNPSGSNESQALGTSGTQQVGYGSGTGSKTPRTISCKPCAKWLEHSVIKFFRRPTGPFSSFGIKHKFLT